MTKRDILKKYGISYMSHTNLNVELPEEEATEFENLVRTLCDNFDDLFFGKEEHLV